MKSRISTGNPDVTVEFQIGEGVWRVSKRFAGQNGSTVLEGKHERYTGTEAETKLADLLGEEVITGKGTGKAESKWAHLWVWQGSSGQDVTRVLSEQNDRLVTQLVRHGGAIVLQSEKDTLVAQRFEEMAREIFTSRGTYKAGSEYTKREKALKEAEGEFERLKSEYQRREKARDGYVRAGKRIEELEKRIKRLRDEIQGIEAALVKLEKLQAKRETLIKDISACRSDVNELARKNERLERLTKEIEQVRELLHKERNEIASAEVETGSIKKILSEWEREIADVRKRLHKARKRKDFFIALSDLIRERARVARLEKEIERLEALKKQLAEKQKELASIPDIKKEDVDELEELHQNLAETKAALRAMAAGIELEKRGSLSVEINGRPLRHGDEAIITDETRITVGDVVLFIRPGGGNELARIRKQVVDIRNSLQKRLDALKVESVKMASEMSLRRTGIIEKIREIEKRIKNEGLDNAEAEIELARNKISILEGEVSAMLQQLGTDMNFPETEDEIRAEQKKTEFHIRELEARESVLNENIEEYQTRESDYANGIKQTEKECARLESHLAALKTEFDLLARETGGVEGIRKSLEKIRKVLGRMEDEEKAIDNEISALGPDALKNDLQNANKSLEELSRQLEENRRIRDENRGRLKMSGDEDIEEQIRIAHDRLVYAKTNLEAEKNRTEAIRLVARLLSKKQKEVSDRYSAPLSDRINKYVNSVFLQHAEVVAQFDGNALKSIELVRKDMGGERFPFDSLSGGTREQVAAAVRLAVAEILAEGHDGSLPVVFDDAFTNSDPDRIRGVHRMLNLASSSGLQIIVLTSNPSDYDMMGGRILTLRQETDMQVI
jgi:DNA repair exonuclease SbcCD ATPase subunit